MSKVKKIRIAVLSIVALSVLYNVVQGYYIKKKKAAGTEFFGNIEIKEVNLGFKVSGAIVKTLAEEGDFVEKGTVLAILDPIPYKKSLDFAEATMKSLETDFKNAKLNLKRNEEIYKKGYISGKEYDDMVALSDSLEQRWLAQKEQLEIAKDNLSYTKLLAPSDGIITTKVFENGAVLSVGQPAYTLLLPETAEARSYVSEMALTKIEYGSPAIIKTDAGNQYDAKVTFISPRAEFTPKTVETQELKSDLVYRFKVTALKPDNKLKQGMPVTIMVVRPK